MFRAFPANERTIVTFGNYFEAHFVSCMVCMREGIPGSMYLYFDEDLAMHACAACVRSKSFELPPVSFLIPKPLRQLDIV